MRAERKDAQALIDCSFAAYEYKIEQERYENRSAKGNDLDGMPKQRGAVRGMRRRMKRRP